MNLALAWDKTDLRIMQKLNTLTNISTFWAENRWMPTPCAARWPPFPLKRCPWI